MHFLISRNWIDIINQEMGLIFLYRQFDFFITRNGFFISKSIFYIKKYRMNSKTAPQPTVLLFIPYLVFFIFDIKNSNPNFWYKNQPDFFLYQEIYFRNKIQHKSLHLCIIINHKVWNTWTFESVSLLYPNQYK